MALMFTACPSTLIRIPVQNHSHQRRSYRQSTLRSPCSASPGILPVLDCHQDSRHHPLSTSSRGSQTRFRRRAHVPQWRRRRSCRSVGPLGLIRPRRSALAIRRWDRSNELHGTVAARTEWDGLLGYGKRRLGAEMDGSTRVNLDP